MLNYKEYIFNNHSCLTLKSNDYYYFFSLYLLLRLEIKLQIVKLKIHVTPVRKVIKINVEIHFIFFLDGQINGISIYYIFNRIHT